MSTDALSTASAATVHPSDLGQEAIALARTWLEEASHYPVDPAAERLAGVLRDPNGLDFTVGFVDGVVRPEDTKAAAKKLSELTALTPAFLPTHLRGAIGLGGTFAKPLPGIVVPIARKVLREMVSHLIIDASDAKLGRAISQIKRDGVRLNINLLGEAILGEKEAAKRLAGTHALLERADVDYVSIKTSSVMAPHNHWAYDEAVENVIEHLVPLFRKAAQATPQKFINLDMEEYKDLGLTLDVFTQLLDREEFLNLEAGIVLQAYLPDALGAMVRLQEWSAKRVARGGAPIKVRVVKGANLPMEQVAALMHGWPLATWGSKQESDTSYKAVLNYALTPEHVKNVRIGVAGHNLFDIALAWLLAKHRGAAGGLEVEMLLGMATGQAEAVRKDVGSLLLYTPVVHPAEFDVAIAYLIRRLEEGASQENFMSAVFELHENEQLFEREKNRFLASLEALSDSVPEPNRRQDRRHYDEQEAEALITAFTADPYSFANTPDTDPDLPGNQAWGRDIAGRMIGSELGKKTVAEGLVRTSDELETMISTGIDAAEAWQALSSSERAAILHRAGQLMERRRGELLEVAGAECGKTIDQGDVEVSEAIDFANYYAMLGQRLEDVDGAAAKPVKLTAIVPPWNFPIAIPAGGTLAALASGSAVIIKPAAQAARSGAVMVECLWQAGVPRKVLQFAQFDDREVSGKLITDERVERLVLTGGYETAVTFRNMREDLPLLAETSGKNAIIVTPNADLDLAAADVVASAFGHAGQKCSAASLVILVGSVATSKRFRGQLIDAVESLTVGTPEHLGTQMGPVIGAPEGKLLRGLTTLGQGERWLVKPREIAAESPLSVDDSGASKLWSPGVRDGVKRGSEYHLTEYFGPILGIMTASSLDEAIDMVNEIDYGLTSGLHSLDRDEIDRWLSRIEAGNLYVNRGITGAIVQRQPFGGWKKSAIGAGTKAGGPNYLHGLVNWVDAPVTKATAKPLASIEHVLDAAARAGLTKADLEWLRAAAASDAQAVADEFGVARDASGLGVERNILRYHPVATTARVAESASLRDAVRTAIAGLAAGARPTLSFATTPPEQIASGLRNARVTVLVEDEAAWGRRLASVAAVEGPRASARVRVVAADAERQTEARAVYAAVQGKPDIAVYAGPVVSAGRVEMLPYVQEQAVSITAHRFGTPNTLSDGLI
ncbi:proline dehydrogenase family protein [Leucobacter chinensis]|uniref:proline dehydrogenase family protein n=1 Tax=Leucobacter chinensis TaxID=2851010 RepID=UPI001C251211|nr:proline dehydrogenase family protein [Leucobacter chinensis]